MFEPVICLIHDIMLHLFLYELLYLYNNISRFFISFKKNDLILAFAYNYFGSSNHFKYFSIHYSFNLRYRVFRSIPNIEDAFDWLFSQIVSTFCI